MEEVDELGKLSGTADYLPVDCIKGLHQVNEIGVKVHASLDALLLDLSHCEDHVNGATSRTKYTPAFWQGVV